MGPILVAQYNVGSSCSGHSLGDPSMVLLNSVEQTRDTVTLYNSSFENITETFINIITQTDDVPALTFDGSLATDLGLVFIPVGADERFSYAKVPVNFGAHTITSSGCGVIATAYGYGDVESYAYSGGAAFSSINANPIPEGGCLNDTIFFDTGLSPFRYTFAWDLGDGQTSNAAKFSHFYPELGSYPVQLILTDECLGEIDTLNRDLMITLRQAVDTEPDLLDCEGEEIQLSATDLPGARYVWKGPNQYYSEFQFPTLVNAPPMMSGTYEVIGIVSGCATFPAYTEVEIIANPRPDLGPDTLFCARNGFSFTLQGGEFNSYQWQDGSTQAILPITVPGNYFLTVTNEYGCIGSDDINLREQCPTTLSMPNAFSPNGDGVNDQFGILGNDFISVDFMIFDRWGNLIFQTQDPLEAWDGRYNNQIAANGTYVWALKYEGYREDGSTFSTVASGSVTLVQ